MACLLCAPSFLPLATITKPNSHLQVQQKPNSVSFSSVRSHSRHHEYQKYVLPLFPPTHQLSSQTSTTAIKSAVSIPITPIDLDMELSVEHIVLFVMNDPAKENPDSETSKKEIEENLIRAMNSLRCLPGVLYSTAGYLTNIQPASAQYNIFMHTRHSNKDDLTGFMQHALKYGFTMTYTEPYYQDYMVIDYVFGHKGPFAIPEVGNAYRCTFFNLKDGWGEVQRHRVLQAVADSFKGADSQTIGTSYVTPPTYIPDGEEPPPPPNKGYDIGTLSMFSDMDKVLALGTPEAFAQKLETELKDVLDESPNVMVVDYEIKILYDGNRDHLWV